MKSDLQKQLKNIDLLTVTKQINRIFVAVSMQGIVLNSNSRGNSPKQTAQLFQQKKAAFSKLKNALRKGGQGFFHISDRTFVLKKFLKLIEEGLSCFVVFFR